MYGTKFLDILVYKNIILPYASKAFCAELYDHFTTKTVLSLSLCLKPINSVLDIFISKQKYKTTVHGSFGAITVCGNQEIAPKHLTVPSFSVVKKIAGIVACQFNEAAVAHLLRLFYTLLKTNLIIQCTNWIKNMMEIDYSKPKIRLYKTQMRQKRLEFFL